MRGPNTVTITLGLNGSLQLAERRAGGLGDYAELNFNHDYISAADIRLGAARLDGLLNVVGEQVTSSASRYCLQLHSETATHTWIII